jgi:hypothetical protein
MADNLDHGGPPDRSPVHVNEVQAIRWSNERTAAGQGRF